MSKAAVSRIKAECRSERTERRKNVRMAGNLKAEARAMIKKIVKNAKNI